jgi:amidase
VTDRKSGTFYVPHDIAAPIRGAATGPLAGMTAAVKDMYDIAGTRTGGGSPEWLANQKPATHHAGVVGRILDAGATITGKTICEELFYSMVGVNAHYGMPANIRAAGRVPGGSSSGSAAACGAGACDFAIGSDTAGSIRIPASFNGVFGLRATHDRVDLSGAMAMAPTFDAGGWFANGAGMLRRVGHVVLGPGAVTAPVSRIVVAADMMAQADDGVVEVCRSFLERATQPSLEQAAVMPREFMAWCDAFRVLQAFEVWETFGTFVTSARPRLGPGIRERIAFAATVTPQQADSARRVVKEARAQVRDLVPPGTVMVMPTSPAIAPRPDTDGATLDAFRLRVMRLTALAGLGGLPQVSLPAGTVSGCPVGVSFLGWYGGDEALLDLAFATGQHCGIAVG